MMANMVEKLYEFAQLNQIPKEKVDELLEKGRSKGLNEVNLVFFVKSELNKIIRLRNIVDEVVVIGPRKISDGYMATTINSNGNIFSIKTNEKMKEGLYLRRGIGTEAVYEFKQPLNNEIKKKLLEKIDTITAQQLLANNYILNKTYKLKGKVTEIVQKQRDMDVVYDIVMVDEELSLPENLVFFNSLEKIPEFSDVYVLIRIVEIDGEKRLFVEGIVVLEDMPNIVKIN
jgi:hypothetical protein